MAKIRYAASCDATVTVVASDGRKYVWRLPDNEELAHAISDAINRGSRVRSTGLDAGDDWARLRAREMARQAAALARQPHHPGPDEYYEPTSRDYDPGARWPWFARVVERAIDWFRREA